MAGAIEKTESLFRGFWDADRIELNPDNPNEMTDEQFNLLYDNIEKMGITDPLLCVPHPERGCDLEKGEGWLLLVGGEHRLEVARLFGIKEVPVTVVTDESFDADARKFQIVRHNIIHGDLNPEKFLDLYQSLSETYAADVAAELFGFTDEEDFKKLIGSVLDGLPKEMKKDFNEAKEDIKTIDDLTNVLNNLFARYGDTLEHNYMIIDYGGKKSLWVRMNPSGYKAAELLAESLAGKDIGMDAFIHAVISKGVADDEWLTGIVEK